MDGFWEAVAHFYGLIPVGALGAGLGVIAFFPQARKTFRTQRAQDFAWGFLTVTVFVLIFNVLYGIRNSDAPFAILQSLILAQVFVPIVVKLRTEVFARRAHEQEQTFAEIMAAWRKLPKSSRKFVIEVDGPVLSPRSDRVRVPGLGRCSAQLGLA